MHKTSLEHNPGSIETLKRFVPKAVSILDSAERMYKNTPDRKYRSRAGFFRFVKAQTQRNNRLYILVSTRKAGLDIQCRDRFGNALKGWHQSQIGSYSLPCQCRWNSS